MKKALSKSARDTIAFYSFISPWIIGFLLFTIIPMLVSLFFSFTGLTKFDLARGRINFVGFKNYVDILTTDERFLRSILNTFVYSIFRVFLGIFVSLLVALLLNRSIPGRKLFRVLIYIPAIMPIVGSAILWQQLFDQDYSLFNYLLSLIGIGPVNWLSQKNALGSIIVMSVWCGIGPTMIILLAALQNVPQDIVEVAEIDGAGAFVKFFKIILPMISSTLLYLLVTNFIATLQAYAEIDLLTKGGPGNSTVTMSLNVFYSDGTPDQCVIADTTIGGGAEAARCAEKFARENVCATLSVTPCWCYGSETMDLDPLTVKAVWGFNGTERPGAVYLAAVMAAHAQRGLPAFAIYGKDVRDAHDATVPEDVREKILAFARCALAVGQMRNKAYVGIGSVSMGIGGSFLDGNLMQKYFNIRAEWVDMTEILRRIDLGIYDKEEYQKALAWIKAKVKEGKDWNGSVFGFKDFTRQELDGQWEFVAKMTIIIRDIMLGNPKLAEIGWHEEALGRNAILGGFQGQRMWTDYKPNGDFTEAILNSSFDWNGKREPIILATENDNCNGLAMLFAKLLTNRASVFADVRTYWSPEAVERVTGWKPEDLAENGFIHLINSGAAALDGTGACKDEKGNSVIKKWWEVTEKDIDAMLAATEFSPANRGYFRGGGFSSSFSTQGQMPITLIRLNMVDGIGYTMQIAEGWTVELPEKVNKTLLYRTDRTWPSTWFVPRLDKANNAFKDVYSVMANWGANHGAFSYGHIGKELITLASMLRIPVSMHNVADKDIFRPHSWSAFGTKDLEGADYRACEKYGPLYK